LVKPVARARLRKHSGRGNILLSGTGDGFRTLLLDCCSKMCGTPTRNTPQRLALGLATAGARFWSGKVPCACMAVASQEPFSGFLPPPLLRLIPRVWTRCSGRARPMYCTSHIGACEVHPV
jgi:hypothetical protein